MTGQVLALPDARRRRLKELEAVIAHGFAEVVRVGQALREIRDEGLYLELDSGITFEQYCATRWGLHRARPYQYIDAADIDEATSTIVEAIPITTEGVARELAPLLRDGGPTRVAEAWSKVSERYAGQRPPTAREVHAVLVEEGYRPRVGQASTGPTNVRILLGQVGDRIASAEKRLDWFLERDMKGRTAGATAKKTAIVYADQCDAMARRLYRFAGLEQ